MCCSDAFAIEPACNHRCRSFVAVLEEEVLRKPDSYPLRKRYATGSCHYFHVLLEAMPDSLELCWRDVAAVRVEPRLVVPGHP